MRSTVRAHLEDPRQSPPELGSEVEQEQAPEGFRRPGRGSTAGDRPRDAGADVAFGRMRIEFPRGPRVRAFRLHAEGCC